MRKLMDEVRCLPRGQRGNLLRMYKHCRRRIAPPSPPASA
jgi:hypothetical protein